MEPDSSSRAAARRIVEEVLADHAARVSGLDGVAPIVIPARPDTPSWRTARRIVEETLAEHAARAVIPPGSGLEVSVGLHDRDVELVLDLGEPGAAAAPSPPPGDGSDDVPVEPPIVTNVVAPIEAEETSARAARRIAETTLAASGHPPTPVTPETGPPIAFEIDPIPEEPAASEPDPEPEVETTSHRPAAQSTNGAVDEDMLGGAIPDRLFAPLAGEEDPERDDPPAADELRAADDEPVTPVAPVEAVASPAADGPPPPPGPLPTDPDHPAVIAARIVADVLAAREQLAIDEATADRDAADLEQTPDGEDDQPGWSGTLVLDPRDDAVLDPSPPGIADHEPDGGGAAATVLDPHDGDERDGAGADPVPTAPREPEPAFAAAEPEAQDVEPVTPLWYEPSPGGPPAAAQGPSEAFTAEDLDASVATDDEFGAWPDPVVPPRRTGRWLLTTVLGAIALALLLPLTIGALRDLLSFS